MPIVPALSAAAVPTNLARLPRLFAYTQAVGLGRYLRLDPRPGTDLANPGLVGQ